MDNYEKNARLVEEAVEQKCAFLQPDPFLVQRVLNAANEKSEVKMKKKISVAFVLVMALMMLSATALAAITLNALYERVIKQESETGNIEDWDAASKVALVDWMVDAGVGLDEGQVARLHEDDLTDEERGELAFEIISAYYPARDGILTSVDIIAKEKGPIENWSLEDKAWLSEIIGEYDPESIAMGMNLLPGEDDISQEEALEAFYNYYFTEYGVERSEFLEKTATYFFGESEFDDGNGPIMRRRWVINMMMTDGNDAGAYISTDGEIISATEPYNMQPEWDDQSIRDTQRDEFTTIEGIYAYEQKWRPVMEQLQANGVDLTNKYLPYFLDGKSYGLPTDDDIPRETATEIARTTIMENREWEEDWFKYCSMREAYRTEDPNGPMYWIVFKRYLAGDLAHESYEMGLNAFIPKVITVKIDAHSGEVAEILSSDEVDEFLFDRFGM